MCFCPGIDGVLAPAACTPCSYEHSLSENEKRALSQQRSWRELLASQVADQFDILGIARVAPQPGDYQSFGLASFPSILIHTRDHLHADGIVRITGVHACQKNIQAIPRIATRIVNQLIRIDAEQTQLAELVKHTRQRAKSMIEANDNVVFTGAFIEEVNFIQPENTYYGKPETKVYLQVRYAAKGIAALPSKTHTMITCRLGDAPELNALKRALNRIDEKVRQIAPVDPSRAPMPIAK